MREQSKTEEGKDKRWSVAGSETQRQKPGRGECPVWGGIWVKTAPGQTEEDSSLLAIYSLGLARPVVHIWEMLHAQEKARRSWGQRVGF